MSEIIWQVIAWILSREVVADWLISRSSKTPYDHIRGRDGSLYMGRWWLFNPYPKQGEPKQTGLRASLPSARIHWIRRPDQDPDRHNHPWPARTVILRNWYQEQRELAPLGIATASYHRTRGYTGTIKYGEFHRITEVHPQGAWTLFITWPKKGSWGFRVGDIVVPWRQYLGVPA